MLSTSGYLSSSSTHSLYPKATGRMIISTIVLHLRSQTMFENNIQWPANKSGHGPSSLDMADLR